MAQYRAGRYRDALATLTRSNDLNAGKFPSDLAFLAMCQHRLGQEVAARATLERLEHALRGPLHSANYDDGAFLREAESLILDVAFPANPFAR